MRGGSVGGQRRPGPRGWAGRGRGGAALVEPAPEFRGTTVQVCGLYPFAAGTGSPIVGVPFGQNLISGATVGCDPISWFRRANLIANPSAFVLGLPGLGKSTVVRRMALGLAGYGVQGRWHRTFPPPPSLDRRALVHGPSRAPGPSVRPGGSRSTTPTRAA